MEDSSCAEGGKDSHGFSPMALVCADRLRAGLAPSFALDPHRPDRADGLGAPAGRGQAGSPEWPSRRPGRAFRRPAGRHSPDEPGDRLAARHRGPMAEGRRGPARHRAVPDGEGPLEAGTGRSRRRGPARPPSRRRVGRAGGPDPSLAGAAARPERARRPRTPGRRPAPPRQRDGPRPADPDAVETGERRGRGIRRGSIGRRRTSPGDDQRRRVPVRRPDRPDRIGPRRGGAVPRTTMSLSTME